MGSSAKAALFFGVCYENYHEFPWAKDTQEGEDVIEGDPWSFEEWCKKTLGPEMEAQIYVGMWGYSDDTNWYIAVNATVTCGDWEQGIPVTLPDTPNATLPWVGLLHDFYTKAGMTWPGDNRVGWWLVAGYG